MRLRLRAVARRAKGRAGRSTRSAACKAEPGRAAAPARGRAPASVRTARPTEPMKPTRTPGLFTLRNGKPRSARRVDQALSTPQVGGHLLHCGDRPYYRPGRLECRSDAHVFGEFRARTAQRGASAKTRICLLKFCGQLSPVGSPQRPEIKHWCGFPADPFGYNGRPTSSCQTFCWKARHPLGRAFFLAPARPCGPAHRGATRACTEAAAPLRLAPDRP